MNLITVVGNSVFDDLPEHDLRASPPVTTTRGASILDVQFTAIVIIVERIRVRLDVIVQLTSREALMWT